MKVDSVFSAALTVPFPDDVPLIPVGDIERALNAIEQASSDRQGQILHEQTDRLLQRAAPFLANRDAAGITALEWNAGVALQAPIFSVWSMGWQLGSAHMIREMIAAVPGGVRQRAEGRGQKAEGRRQKAEGRRQRAEGRGQEVTQNSKLPYFPLPTSHSLSLTFATPQELHAFASSESEALIAALLQLQPGTIVNTAAEQAVLRRTMQLAGSFSNDQLAKVKLSLIGAISPDADGKVLSRKQLLDRLQVDLQVGRVRSEMIARTETSFAYNSARIQTARKSSLVTHFRYLSILDSRTTAICTSRNGLVFKVEDANLYRPPSHVRCRATISPLLPSIQPKHAEMVENPDRQPENRQLVPLPEGWRLE